MKRERAASANFRIKVAIGVNSSGEIEIRTAEERAIVVAEDTELENGNERDLRSAHHADFLAAGFRCGGNHVHRDQLCPQALVWSGLNLSERGLQWCAATRLRGNGVILPCHARDHGLVRTESTDVTRLRRLRV